MKSVGIVRNESAADGIRDDNPKGSAAVHEDRAYPDTAVVPLRLLGVLCSAPILADTLAVLRLDPNRMRITTAQGLKGQDSCETCRRAAQAR
jgi:hypothetical protein